MVYLGRGIWLFSTEEGRFGKFYSVEGRSSASRERKAVYHPGERRVAIEPLDKSQIDPLRHYNATRFGDGLLVVSNGLHTEDIYNSQDKRPVGLRRRLNTWGVEPDSLHTPRIAGMLNIHGIVNNPLLYLGMVSDNGVRSIRVKPNPGYAYGISTYNGDENNPKPFDINLLSKQSRLPKVRVEGETPEEIAEFFATEVIDPKFFVSGVSAVWYEEDRDWRIAVRNLHS